MGKKNANLVMSEYIFKQRIKEIYKIKVKEK
jgi:ribosomal protein S2